MFKKLGQRVLNRKARQNEKVERRTLTFDQVKTVGILVKNFSRNEKIVHDFVKEFSKHGKKVYLLCYNTEDQKEKNAEVVSLSKKDINWIGVFKPYSIKKFIKTDFDYLFSLNTSPFLPFENVMALSEAKCRIGIYNKRHQNSYELMIHSKPKDGLKKLTKEMMFYIKQIK